MALLETYYNNINRVRELYPNTLFISISRELPHSKNGASYNPCDEWDTSLAPSRKLVRDYKSGKITWAEYILLFKDEMSTDEAQGSMWILAQRAAAKDICLVCFEGPKDGERCHRFLLLDMIYRVANNNGINLHVRKTGYSQPNKFIKSKRKVSGLFDF